MHYCNMKITERGLKIYDRVLGTLSAVAIIFGGWWTIYGFTQEKINENEVRWKQIIWDKFKDKKSIYFELCDAEAEIAACNSYEEVVMAQKHFRKLFVGRAHIIATLDTAVNNQKVDFRDTLDYYLEHRPATKPFDYFINSCLILSALIN